MRNPLSPKKQRRVHMKLRQTIYVTITLSLVGCIVIPIWLHLSDSCRGKAFTEALCHLYKEGQVDGDLCPQLCRYKTITLSSCEKQINGDLLFYWNQTQIRLRKTHVHHMEYGGSLAPLYTEPPEGTSMEQFSRSVENFVMSKLGQGDQKKLVSQIMEIADANHDAKVSLAEAKSIWALLQHHEFFIMVIFGDNEHIPAIKGFCGDVFAIEYIPQNYLYTTSEEGSVNGLWPWMQRWSWPSWHQRARVVVGLLEFTMDVYQHSSAGSFYMCGNSHINIGYNEKYDVKIVDLSQVIPLEELHGYLYENHCTYDQQCSYTLHCTTVCDRTQAKCTDRIIRPNLQVVCKIIQPFISPDAPSAVTTDLARLLEQCVDLNSNTTQLELRHALVLNELKSLLWNQIS